MLGLYEWSKTVRVLWNLAKFYPELTSASAPLQPIPPQLAPFTQAGQFTVKPFEYTKAFRLTAPHEARDCPLILFSGGGGDDGNYYDGIARHWASYGFVVVQPVHFDSYQHHLERTGSRFWAHQKTTWDVWGLVLGEERMWRSRCEDIRTIVEKNGDFGGRVDPQRIGIGGYSYGAWVASLLAGGEMRTRQGRMSFPEVGAKCVVCISPEWGCIHQPKNVWKTLRVPILLATGELDRTVWRRDAREKWQAFAHAPFHLKQILDIAGANHFAFSGRLLETAQHPADLEAQRAIFSILLGTTTKFWLENL